MVLFIPFFLSYYLITKTTFYGHYNTSSFVFNLIFFSWYTLHLLPSIGLLYLIKYYRNRKTTSSKSNNLQNLQAIEASK